MRPGPVYVLGATSMPGWSVIRHAAARPLVPFCSPHVKLPACRRWRRFNLEDEAAYRDLFNGRAPEAIIHAGGICDIEKCEANPGWAHQVNVQSLAHLLNHIPGKTRLVYISSDHVFGGRAKPYDENSTPAPISVYGRTRVQAERLILERKENSLILRCALGIGPSIDGRTGHLSWLRYRRDKHLPVTIIRDEVRSAVWAEDLAQRILDYCDSPVTGLRHITAARAVSRIKLARYLNARFGLGLQFSVKSRKERPVPHLGRVELATIYKDPLAAPLPPVA
ncbi:MAG: hypothetical protein A3G41_06765 [Elusimicrobia bacterium RIFCSPLOWO2_12_FULL_59_9]|nr:MAG: hypothetical protein A3G41_06765 [Elusimicrobia bacterium RIFCSPLOWO2_12_FULL_59_9]